MCKGVVIQSGKAPKQGVGGCGCDGFSYAGVAVGGGTGCMGTYSHTLLSNNQRYSSGYPGQQIDFAAGE